MEFISAPSKEKKQNTEITIYEYKNTHDNIKGNTGNDNNNREVSTHFERRNAGDMVVWELPGKNSKAEIVQPSERGSP